MLTKEGAGRQLQERRLRLSPQGQSLPCERTRLRGQGAGQGRAVRCLRRDGQCRLRQLRHHQRYRRVRGAVDPLLARAHGPRALSPSNRADDHRRLRRLKRRARAAVEGRAAEARRPDRPHPPRSPLPTGDVEVEQDRAPPLLPHHAELARPAADRAAGR